MLGIFAVSRMAQCPLTCTAASSVPEEGQKPPGHRGSEQIASNAFAWGKQPTGALAGVGAVNRQSTPARPALWHRQPVGLRTRPVTSLAEARHATSRDPWLAGIPLARVAKQNMTTRQSVVCRLPGDRVVLYMLATARGRSGAIMGSGQRVVCTSVGRRIHAGQANKSFPAQ